MASGVTGFIHRHRHFAVFIVLMVVFRSSFADWNDVPSSSMHPTIIEGDRVWVNKLAYDLKPPLSQRSLLRLGEPARGDIVVFDSKAADIKLIKRVIGLPGDEVALRGNRLVINGVIADYLDPRPAVDGVSTVETFRPDGDPAGHRVVRAMRSSPVASFGPVTVPEDHYLVLGDNRDNSADSRVYGFVPRSEIAGRATNVVFSLDYERWLRPRPDRFLHPL